MIQLVNDILQLSHLDNVSETGAAPAMETVDLLDVARECVERQKVNARRSYISLTYLGESAPVAGSRSLLDELCQNLCDNAIRYNRLAEKSRSSRPAPGRSLHPDREGQRHRYPERGADQRVRALLPGGQEPQQSHRRHRSGSGHRQTHRPHPHARIKLDSVVDEYHHHRDLRNGFLTFHEFHVCPNFRADVFCCKRKVTVTQCLMRTESGDVQPQRPAAADGVRTEASSSASASAGRALLRESAFTRRRKLSPSRSTPQKARRRRSGPTSSAKRCSPVSVQLLPAIKVPFLSGTRSAGRSVPG